MFSDSYLCIGEGVNVELVPAACSTLVWVLSLYMTGWFVARDASCGRVHTITHHDSPHR